MRRKRGKKSFKLFKIDLEKAYDKMSWAFIEETLLLLRVTRIFVELVMSCLRPASTSTIWNGSVVVSFQPSRGVRQGCPLSPYLFVMCMERLT